LDTREIGSLGKGTRYHVLSGVVAVRFWPLLSKAELSDQVQAVGEHALGELFQVLATSLDRLS